MKNRNYFRKLLAENKIKQLLSELLDVFNDSEKNDLYDNVLLLSSRFTRNEDQNKKNIISESNYNLELNRVVNALNVYLNELPEDSKSAGDSSDMNNSINNSSNTKSVFISYNHKDKEIVAQIKKKIIEANLNVTIDSESMQAGEDIKNFIDKSISETDVTLSIVSINSLLSSWVALESMQTFSAEKIVKKQFIAGFIDSSFFSRDFVDQALDKIEIEINSIREIVKKRLDKDRNINDLQHELERFTDLEHNLPKIVNRLKSSLSIDLSEENFDSGMDKIINSIKN